MSAALTNAAQSQANYMASIGRMTHTGAGGTSVGTRVTRAGFRWSMVGENIAYGQTSSSAVVYAWLTSPPHAANMFNPKYTLHGRRHRLRPRRVLVVPRARPSGLTVRPTARR